MKIKYVDKTPIKTKKKKITIEKVAISMATVFMTSCLAGGIFFTVENSKFQNKRYNIMTTEYNIADKKYDIIDVYLLYNDKEILNCYKEKELIGTDYYQTLNISRSALLNMPIFSKQKKDVYLYKFYDITNDNLVASTLYDYKSSEEAINDIKYRGILEEYNQEIELLNGYEYKNLGSLMLEDNIDKQKGDNINYLDEDYIEESIEQFYRKKDKFKIKNVLT